MAGKKNSSLDRVLGRLDTLDSVNLANLVQRLARERGVFEEIFNTLQAAPGSRVSSDGNVIASVITLPDGRGGTVLVNRSTGKLTVISS